VRRIGGFTIESELGRGGMGVVYRARDEARGVPVALKVMTDPALADRSTRDRFLHEGWAGAQLAHPHVVKLHSVGEENGTPFLVFELVTGGSLATRLRHEGRLPWREVARLGRQVASALAAVHEAGLLHRDLKPANVLLDQHGDAKLTDFGVARLPGSVGSLTQTGELVGTMGYLAPEHLANASQPWDVPSDLYGLGATLYALLTGRAPFEGADVSTIWKTLNARPPSPRETAPEIPRALEAVVLRLLDRDPTKRGASAAEVARDLASIEAPPRASRAAALAIAGSGLVALAAIAWLGLPDRRGVALTIEAPLPRTPLVEGSSVHVRGHASGRASVVRAGGQVARPAKDGTWAVDLVLAPGQTSLVAEASDDGGTAAVASVTVIPVPVWFDRTSESERPRLPLPAGVAFGKEGEYVNERDGSRLVFVPGGRLVLRSPNDDATGGFVEAFFLGKLEVTNDQFAAFVAATGYVTRCEKEHDGHIYDNVRRPTGPFGVNAQASWRSPAGTGPAPGNHPALLIWWLDAISYARWAGLRLPTLEEWQKAAGCTPGGTTARRFPWGDSIPAPGQEPVANLADRTFEARWGTLVVREALPGYDDGYELAAPVGSFPRDSSPCGAMDMGGNASEWVASPYERAANPEAEARLSDPGKKWTYRVVGGTYRHRPLAIAAPPRVVRDPMDVNGFRVARSAGDR
jgi:formylglycine-generating enzyme required for sulfatase activity